MKKIYFDKINSTQMYAKEKAKQGVQNEIYIAKIQTAGIGRNGHNWTSNLGGLYFSFITNSYNDIYTLTVGIAVYKALEELYDTYIKDFAKFVQLTDGMIIEEESNGQLKTVFIEDADELSEYLQFNIVQLDEENNYLRIMVKR